MRIALVTREYPPETDWGGIGRFYAAFATALRDSGHDVEVFTQGLTSDRIEEHGGILVHRIVPRKWILGPRTGGDLAGMGVHYIGIFALSLAAAMAARVALRRKVRPFDIVEGHEHLGINALVNAFGNRHFTTVSRYHTTYHSLVSRKLVDWPASWLISRLERYSIQSAHARISASAFIDRMTREDFPGTPECDAVVPLHLSSPPNLHAPPIAERERLMIFVGRLMPGHKSPDLAAAAFAGLADEFPGWRIEFAGSNMQAEGGQTSWDVCEKLLSQYPGRYSYHGNLDQESVQGLYRRARLIVIPSRFESFGLVALEAMSAGVVPIVASDTALPDVTGNCGIVFRNGSIDDLRSKLKEIMTGDQRQTALSEAAQTRARHEFSGEKLIAQNIELFESFLQRRK